MKQKIKRNKTSSSGNVIRTILQQELRNIKTSIVAEIETNVDFKLGGLETRIDERAREYRDQILTSNDKLMKELGEQRQEREIGNFQTKEKLRDHEERLKVLESA